MEIVSFPKYTTIVSVMEKYFALFDYGILHVFIHTEITNLDF